MSLTAFRSKLRWPSGSLSEAQSRKLSVDNDALEISFSRKRTACVAESSSFWTHHSESVKFSSTLMLTKLAMIRKHEINRD